MCPATCPSRTVAITRRRFLGDAAAAAVARASPDEALVFGVVADVQYADAEPAGTRFYRASLAKLRAAAAEFNRRGVAFVLNLGDTVDRGFGSFDVVLDACGSIEAPVRHVLGNHDFDVSDAEKAKVPDRLGLADRRASFVRGHVRFLLLDGTELGPLAHPSDSPRRREAEARIAALKAGGLKQAVPWGGGLGEAQRAWIDRECEAAGRAGQRVVCACHYPIWPDGVHVLFDAAEVRALIARRREIVAWLAGHDHRGGLASFDGVPCVTFRGMVETAETNAFALVRLSPGRMEIEGFGREPSRSLPLRA